MHTAPPANDIREDVRRALQEDIGDGDLSAQAVPENIQAEAEVICRQPAVICGRPWFEEVFRLVDARVRLDWQVADGAQVERNQLVCVIDGPARALLTAERTALNFLQILSGTATRTRRYLEAIAGNDVDLLDTRKTLPGLRQAQKYAVVCGGGRNHRQGLFDGVLLKENHIIACGNIIDAVEQARHHVDERFEVEVEVEDLHQLREAIAAGADAVLLDNMSPDELLEAVKVANGNVRLEASGGITLKNIGEIAETGIDCISVGGLTKDVEAIDLSMRFTAVSS